MFTFYVVMNFYDATFLFQEMIKKKQLSQKTIVPLVRTRLNEKISNFFSCLAF